MSAGLAIGHLDARTEAYVEDVLDAIEAHVTIVEAYLVGSGAVGRFDPQTSDVDLVLVVERPLGPERKRVIEAVADLDCPVRDLELVLYIQGQEPPDVELNLNHGEETDAEPFWFVPDAALAQEHAVPVRNGVSWTELFQPMPDERVRQAARESLAWSEHQATDNEFARVNASRARHYLEHGEWAQP